MRNFVTNFNTAVQQLWLAGIVLVMMIGALYAPAAAAQGSGPLLTIEAPALNVRSGPGVANPVVTFVLQGDSLPVVAYDAASDWWQITLPDGQSGWVSGGPEYVLVSGDLTRIPETAAMLNSAGDAGMGAENIVFQSSVGGPIYAVNPDGTNLRYLTTGLDPVLSPDGRRVAFARWTNSQNGALGSLWLININGSEERNLLSNLHQPRTPIWSADGSQILTSFQQDGRVLNERICGNQKPPRDAVDVRRSVDGRRVTEYCYLLPPDPHWGLRLINVETGEIKDLPNETYSLSPTWDPQNSWRIVYDGNRGLVNLDIIQGTSWPLTEDFNDRSPLFSPDGSKIAVSYRQHRHWEIHTLNADGSGRVRLTETPIRELVRQQLSGELPTSWNNAAPAWSPDGTEIAFLTDRTGQWEIWIMNSDGTNQRPLLSSDSLEGIALQYNGVDEQGVELALVHDSIKGYDKMMGAATGQKILVVDDDKEIVRLIRAYLEQAGYEVLAAYDGETALHILRREHPALVVLDLMLPDRDGWDITRLVRADPDLAGLPLIMLTARIDDTDKIIGLELGADDYVTKPFNPREVVARVRSVLRRSQGETGAKQSKVLQIAELLMDLDRHEVMLQGKSIELTSTEFNILRVLLESPGYAFTRSELIEQGLGYEYEGSERTLDSHMKNLRQKG